MKTFLYLSSCSTCKRIMKELELSSDVELQDIKSEIITEKQLDTLHQYAGSYEALFNKRAQKFKLEGLNQKDLSENDFKSLILKEYTFLKRPALITDKTAIAGNSAKVVEAMKSALNE